MKLSPVETPFKEAMHSWDKNELQIDENTFDKLKDTSMWKCYELLMPFKRKAELIHFFCTRKNSSSLEVNYCSLVLFIFSKHRGPKFEKIYFVTSLLSVTGQG